MIKLLVFFSRQPSWEDMHGGQEDFSNYESNSHMDPSSPPLFVLFCLFLWIVYVQYDEGFRFFKRKVDLQWLAELLLVCSAPLFFSTIFVSNHEFYSFLRYYVCITCLILLYCKHINQWGFSYIDLVIIILFNPLYPIELEKSTWQFLDFLVGLRFYVEAMFFTKRE